MEEGYKIQRHRFSLTTKEKGGDRQRGTFLEWCMQKKTPSCLSWQCHGVRKIEGERGSAAPQESRKNKQEGIRRERNSLGVSMGSGGRLIGKPRANNRGECGGWSKYNQGEPKGKEWTWCKTIGREGRDLTPAGGVIS